MDYKTLTELYVQLTSEIDVLLNNNEFLNMMRVNDNLLDIMIDRLSTANFLEKKLSDKDFIKTGVEQLKKENKGKKEKAKLIELKDLNKTKILVDKLKTVYPNTKELKKVSYTKVEDIKDSINYLNVFLKNNYKKSIEDFSKKDATEKTDSNAGSKKVETATAEKVSNGTFNNQNNQARSNPFFGNPGGFGGGGIPPHMSQEAFKENYLYTLANQRLNQDIMNGTFYKFKTKPKEVVVFKKVIACLFWTIALIGIISVILSWLSAGLVYDIVDGKSQVMNNTNNIFSLIFVILYTLIYSYIGWQLFKNDKNENRKYDLQKMVLVIFCILFALQLFSLIQVTVVSFAYIDKIEADPNQFGNDQSKIDAFKASTYLNVIQDVVYLFAIIFIGVAMFFAPKIDHERIQLKLREYVEEMRHQI